MFVCRRRNKTKKRRRGKRIKRAQDTRAQKIIKLCDDHDGPGPLWIDLIHEGREGEALPSRLAALQAHCMINKKKEER